MKSKEKLKEMQNSINMEMEGLRKEVCMKLGLKKKGKKDGKNYKY